MADVCTSRRWVPRAIVLLAGAGALLVSGYLASIYVREELAIAALRSPDLERRVAAAETLGELGTVRAIPALLDCERPEEEYVDVSRMVYEREPAYAFAALDRLLRPAAVPRLLRLAQDAKPANRVWGLQALGRLDAREDEAFRALERALEDKELEVVTAAATSLLRFGRTARQRLVDLLIHRARWKHNAGVVGRHACRLLARLGPLAWPAVEHAPRIAKDEILADDALSILDYLDAGVWGVVGAEWQQRIANAAPWEKARLAWEVSVGGRRLDFADGSRQHEMAPALEALLDDESPDVREAAVIVLKWCTGRVSEKMLRVALDVARDGTSTEAEDGAYASFWAFYEIAPTSVEALRPLVRPLEEADPDRYALLLYTLAESAEHHPAALTLLQEHGVSAEAVPGPELTAEPPKSLAGWLELVRGDDLEAHQEAIQQLRELEPSAAELPLLERSLADPDAAVRAVAAHLIGKLGPAASEATRALEACLQKDSLTVRLHAALALCQLGAMRPELEGVFREAAAMERTAQHAAEGLVRLRVGDEARLRELLLDRQGEEVAKLALRALESLEWLGPDAAPAVPFLRDLARDPAGEHAGSAVTALGSIGPAASAAAPELERYARHASSTERTSALWALRAVSPTAEAAAIHAAALLDPDDEVSKAVTEGLLELAPHAADTIPFLVSCLRRNHRALYASVILSRIGAPAVPALLETLDDADADLRTWAAWTLGGMEGAAAGAVAALERRLQDPDELARAAAAHALGLIGKPAERSIAALERLTSDASMLVRRQTTTALRRLRDPQAWRPARRDLPPEEDDFRCGNAILEEWERFHVAICERHATP